jgi:hypothetical protein
LHTVLITDEVEIGADDLVELSPLAVVKAIFEQQSVHLHDLLVKAGSFRNLGLHQAVPA